MREPSAPNSRTRLRASCVYSSTRRLPIYDSPIDRVLGLRHHGAPVRRRGILRHHRDDATARRVLRRLEVELVALRPEKVVERVPRV